jgi:hypothetical protein
MASADRPSVLLLHDQLLDARAWRGFADLVSSHADVLTVTAPTPAKFRSRPREWAADVETAAQQALAGRGPVDLALAAGWAIGAALSLLERGAARRALLVNPWPPPAVFEDLPPVTNVADLTDEDRQRFAPAPEGPDTPAPSAPAVQQIDDEGVVIDLPTVTPFPWLEDPQRMDAIVREVLGRQ